MGSGASKKLNAEKSLENDDTEDFDTYTQKKAENKGQKTDTKSHYRTYLEQDLESKYLLYCSVDSVAFVVDYTSGLCF